MNNEGIYALLHGDVDSRDAFEAIDELVARNPKAEAICAAMEEVLDGDGKKRFEHLSWPATVLHIMARACDV